MTRSTTARSNRPLLAVQQLPLFDAPAVPERFRLDEATRRRGMRHVAELRARLEARYPSPTPSGSIGPRAGRGTRANSKAA